MRSFLLITVISLALVACAPTNRGPQVSSQMTFDEAVYQQEESVKNIKPDIDRIFAVGRNILRENADYCYSGTSSKDRYIDYGFHLKATTFLDKGWNLYDTDTLANSDHKGDKVKGQPRILYVEPNSPSHGKLRIGDEILSVNNILLDKETYLKNLKLFKDEVYEKAPNVLNMSISRNGRKIQVSVMGEVTCPSRLLALINHGIKQDGDINAYADGQNIIITTSISRFADKDSELALVIGHELAHNMMAHIDKGRTNSALGSIADLGIAVLTGVHSNTFQAIGANAYSQSFEQEADYIGIYLAANAGYKMDKAPDFWRRFATKYPEAIHLVGSSHPSTAQRHVALSMAVKEINRKKAQGLPLHPDDAPEMSIDRPTDASDATYND